MNINLLPEDFEWASQTLRIDVPSIMSVTEVEAPRGAFISDGRPSILFERHVFYREYSKKHGKVAADKLAADQPGICSPKAGGYGKEGAHQHERMGLATTHDRECALKAASWGAFQIMGFNHIAAGHPTLQGFINAMYESARKQLEAFVSFLQTDKGGRMIPKIREKKWAAFAADYNGADYAINNYDKKLAAAYKKHSK